MDITKLSVEALKALAYDEIGKLEQAQNSLRLINVEIAQKQKETAIQDKQKA